MPTSRLFPSFLIAAAIALRLPAAAFHPRHREEKPSSTRPGAGHSELAADPGDGVSRAVLRRLLA